MNPGIENLAADGIDGYLLLDMAVWLPAPLQGWGPSKLGLSGMALPEFVKDYFR
jgi:hypothetical protein